MPFFTRNGDDGTTGLLGDKRVPKYHLKPQAYGTVDEASAALGLARSLSVSEKTKTILRDVQRDLYHLMAELAASSEAADRFRVIDEGKVAWLEDVMAEFEPEVTLPKDFILVGDVPAAAALDVARTIVRRAERSVAQLLDEGELENARLLVYLNRLSSLCFVLMLWEHQEAGFDAPAVTRGKSS